MTPAIVAGTNASGGRHPGSGHDRRIPMPTMTMRSRAAFEAAITKLLENEGGFSDHPNDSGGATAFGISQRWLDSAGIGIKAKDITREKAIMLYWEHFWLPYAFAEWIQTELAAKVFDATVNMGPAWAMRCFQRALRACGASYVDDDGVFGPITARGKALVVTQSFGEERLLSAYRSELAGRYREIVALDPSQNVFLKGWLRRAYES